ncbi:uncharacterized protein PAC_08350 [Phialocephala subalpina]|uniref:G protein-coupled receptor GPR1/2/3 C-terminal domain-containing protein n=1 Tax=Phialocephala subalpina TaxID=576137 RepID=A0A1L7X0A4_9HELO|nr:uncharacterized protein PAC_08350 [Phialocephala subalpina]
MPTPSHSLVSRVTEDANGLFPSPFSVNPLPDHLGNTLLPVAIMGLFSFMSTFGLLCFITHRMIAWKKYYRTFPGYNQYLLLIYNLLLADFQQSIAFLLSFHWISKNAILAPTAACFIQGWMVQVGDVGSGIWVLAIGLHTWYSVTGRKLGYFAFTSCIVSIWIFILVLAVIGPISHKSTYFVSTGAWCWINENYRLERVLLHYMWILLAQFGTVVIYTIVFFYLRRHANQVEPASRSPSSRKIGRAARSMVFYPIAYVAFSLPLPAGRLALWSGREVSLNYFCATATLMTSCGLVDTILYTLTRRVLVTEIGDGSLGTAESVGDNRVMMSSGMRMQRRRGDDPSDSTEEIFGIVKTQRFEVTGEPVTEETFDVVKTRVEIKGKST